MWVHGNDLVDFPTADDVVTTIETHRLWDATTTTFTDAINLRVGEDLLGANGQLLAIAGERIYDQDLTAYNLQIDGIHTYYAGNTPVLVHNMCPANGTPRTNIAQNKQFSDAIRTAERDLGRRLSKDEIQVVHREISGQDFGYHEIVDVARGLFGGSG